MPVDASIYGLIQQPKERNPLADMAQAMQVQHAMGANALNDYTLRKAQRQDQETNAIAALLKTPGFKLDTPEGQAQAYSVAPTVAPTYIKSQQEAAKARADMGKTEAETGKLKTEAQNQRVLGYRDQLSSITSPQQAAQWLTSLHNDPALQGSAIASVPLEQKVAAIPQDPDGFNTWKQQMALGAVKFTELNKPNTTVRNTGGTTDVLQTPGMGGPATVVSSVQNTVSPDAKLSAETQRRGQDMTNQRAVEQNNIQSGQRTQQGVIELRKEFNALPEVKNYKEVLPIIQSVQRAPDTPAGDIDMIYGVGKIMDPNSVVREGEMTMAIKAGSPAQRLEGLYSYVKGGGRLSQSQRHDLMQVMESRVSGLKSNYSAARSTYETAATKQNLPKDQIFIDGPEPAVSIGQLPSGGAGGKGGAKVVNFSDLK